MRNEEQRIWRDYMTIYTPTEEWPSRIDGIDFTSIRRLMKYIRERFPERDWKAVKWYTPYGRKPCHQIKFTYDVEVKA